MDASEYREWILAGLALLIFCVPVSVYVIGSMLGAGVQFPLFRYQETYMGMNVITIFRDLQYVLEGTISGRSALMPLFWIGGVIFGMAGFVFVAVPSRIHQIYSTRRGGICIILAGILYLLAIIAQYGPTLSSSGGFAIPVGVPVLLVVGWLMWSGMLFPEENKTDGVLPEDEESQDISS